ncbi:hypothetical protein ACFQZU_13360, partial [Streptomonospora algeriensis]
MNSPGENPYEPGRPDYSGQPGQTPSGYSGPSGQPGYPGYPGGSGPQQGWQQPPQQPYGGGVDARRQLGVAVDRFGIAHVGLNDA